MKTKKGFKLINVCNENIIVAEGLSNIDFSSIISLNDSAAYLWKNIQEKEFDEAMLTDLLMEEYEVEKETARQDAMTLIGQWKHARLLED